MEELLKSLAVSRPEKNTQMRDNLHLWDKSCTWFFHYVGDAAGTILPVLKGDFSLAGALYSNGQTASTCLSGPNTKFS